MISSYTEANKHDVIGNRDPAVTRIHLTDEMCSLHPTLANKTNQTVALGSRVLE